MEQQVFATVECNTSDPTVGTFASEFRALCANIYPERKKELTTSFYSFGDSKAPSTISYIGVSVLTNNVTFKCYSGPPVEISAKLSDLVSANWPIQSLANTNLQCLIQCFQMPALAIGIFSHERAIGIDASAGRIGEIYEIGNSVQKQRQFRMSTADFYAVGSTPTDPIIMFCPTNDRVTVSWQFTAPANSWRSNFKMTSVPDLADAVMVVCLTNFPIRTRFALKPQNVTLDFSKVTIKLSKFLSASPPFNAPPPPTIPPDQLKKLKAALLQTNTSDLNITNSPALSIVTKDGAHLSFLQG